MDNYDPNSHHRRSTRLHGYDYAQEVLYFVTLVCKDRLCLFGNISGVGVLNHSLLPFRPVEMILNDAGNIANQCWLDIPNHFPDVILHEYIVMPNHVHGIIQIIDVVGANKYSPSPVDELNVRTKNFSPLRKSPSRTLGSIVRGYKIGVTKWMRQNTEVYDIWQRNYWDHIIRNDKSYLTIADYIVSNPAKWLEDKFYTQP